MELVQFKASVLSTTPLLIGGVGQGGDTDALVKRFGSRWRRTPAKECWCITSPGAQFTIVPYRDLWDIAFYDYETVEEFRKAFEDKSHVYNAIYFQTQPGDKYTGVAVIRFMRERGLVL